MKREILGGQFFGRRDFGIGNFQIALRHGLPGIAKQLVGFGHGVACVGPQAGSANKSGNAVCTPALAYSGEPMIASPSTLANNLVAEFKTRSSMITFPQYPYWLFLFGLECSGGAAV